MATKDELLAQIAELQGKNTDLSARVTELESTPTPDAESNRSGLIFRTGLFPGKDKNGQKMLSGRDGRSVFYVFKNTYKTKDSQPPMRLMQGQAQFPQQTDENELDEFFGESESSEPVEIEDVPM